MCSHEYTLCVDRLVVAAKSVSLFLLTVLDSSY